MIHVALLSFRINVLKTAQISFKFKINVSFVFWNVIKTILNKIITAFKNATSFEMFVLGNECV